jgi:4-aminobutyrate aminotransferase
VLSTIADDGLTQRAADLGERMRRGLEQALPAGMGVLRGRGLSLGVPLVDAAGAASPDLARRASYRAWQLGAVVFYVGGSVLEVTPPLVLTDDEADLGVELIVRAIEEAPQVTDAEVAPFAGW